MMICCVSLHIIIYFPCKKINNMKKVTLSLILLVAAVLGIQAQGTTEKDLDAKYTQGLLKVGTEAPDFTIKGKKSDKNIFQLSKMRPITTKEKQIPGVWTLIDFWATWCPDCRKEMPTLKEINEKYFTKLQMVGVSFDTDSTKLSQYCKDNNINWPQYSEYVKWKDTKISKEYNISWLPTMYLIDPDGKVAYTTVLAENMKKKIEELNKDGKLTEYMTMPYFPGGASGFLNSLKHTMKYPALAQKYEAQARVVVSFFVDKDGAISYPKITNYKETSNFGGKYFNKLSGQEQALAHSKVRSLFEQEAIRTLNSMGNWIPATKRGKKVRVKYTCPFVFSLQ